VSFIALGNEMGGGGVDIPVLSMQFVILKHHEVE